jgi:hypothetical protein
MRQIPEEDLRTAVLIAANPRVRVGIFQFGFSRLVHEVECNVSRILDARKIQQAEAAVEWRHRRPVFLKNVGERPIRKRGDAVFGFFELF